MMNIIPHPTSLSTLSEHDWNILSARWSRGIDWMIHKLGKRHWVISGFPLFKTKTEAYERASYLILTESAYRASKRLALTTEPTEQGNQYVIPGCEKDTSRGPKQIDLF